MIEPKIDASTLWFTSAQLGTLMVEYGDRALTEEGLDWGIAKLDSTNIQAFSGQLNFIVARPGNGKTTVAAFRAKRAAKKILERGTQDKECVLVISLDQAVEEVYAMMTANSDFTVTDLAWGRVPRTKLVKRALDTVDLPIRMIGKSTMRRSRTIMTFDEIFSAIDNIAETHHVRPVHILLDYIQVARPSKQRSKGREEEVSEAVLRAEDMSYKYGASIDICAQATRGVDKYANKLPVLSDCQWSSAIEQAGYRVWSIWRPILTEPEGSWIDLNGHKYQVQSSLLVLKQLKHKMTEAGYTYVLKLEPDTVQLFDYEART